MSPSEPVRIDVWLWAVRAFKTRALAASACRKGQVSVAGAEVKPARLVRPGDEVVVERPFLHQRLRVLETLKRRVGAGLVSDFCEDLTPEEELEAARKRREEIAAGPSRDAGAGRPTKKDRRELDAAEDDDARRQQLFKKWIENSGL